MTSCNSYVQTQDTSTSQAAFRSEISSGMCLCASAGDVRLTAFVVTADSSMTSTVEANSGPTSMPATTTTPVTPASTGMAAGRMEVSTSVALVAFAVLGSVI